MYRDWKVKGVCLVSLLCLCQNAKSLNQTVASHLSFPTLNALKEIGKGLKTKHKALNTYSII